MPDEIRIDEEQLPIEEEVPEEELPKEDEEEEQRPLVIGDPVPAGQRLRSRQARDQRPSEPAPQRHRQRRSQQQSRHAVQRAQPDAVQVAVHDPHELARYRRQQHLRHVERDGDQWSPLSKAGHPRLYAFLVVEQCPQRLPPALPGPGSRCRPPGWDVLWCRSPPRHRPWA